MTHLHITEPVPDKDHEDVPQLLPRMAIGGQAHTARRCYRCKRVHVARIVRLSNVLYAQKCLVCGVENTVTK